MISASVQASEWLDSFVVWDGKVYKMNHEELIEESELVKEIGKVKTQANYDNRSSAIK